MSCKFKIINIVPAKAQLQNLLRFSASKELVQHSMIAELIQFQILE
jgi:hypothetical protein